MPKTIKYVFRMVHIANIPHILKEGFVHSDSPRAAKDYVSIGDKTLIETRGKKLIDGRPLNETMGIAPDKIFITSEYYY